MKDYHKNTVNLYLDRYKKYGPENMYSLTWGSRESQEIRFTQLLRIFNVENKVILDAGCGWGDLYSWLISLGIELKDYHGIDLCPHNIDLAKAKNPSLNFIQGAIPEQSLPEVDITFSSGIFGFDAPQWEVVVKSMIDSMWETSREGICFNMQVARELPNPPKGRILDPVYWLDYAFTKSWKVVLFADYLRHAFTIGVMK